MCQVLQGEESVAVRHEVVTQLIYGLDAGRWVFCRLTQMFGRKRKGFKTSKQTVAAVRVVNDCAERAVKLATDYNMALTHEEEQRQLTFQVVEHHRERKAALLNRKFTEVENNVKTS